MTPEEINREIAEKVMGYRQIQGWSHWWFPNKESVTLDDAITDFDPMHKIEHAWMVVDKLAELGYELVLARTMDKEGKTWLAELHSSSCWYKFSESAQEAICLAALEAVRWQAEECDPQSQIITVESKAG